MVTETNGNNVTIVRLIIMSERGELGSTVIFFDVGQNKIRELKSERKLRLLTTQGSLPKTFL